MKTAKQIVEEINTVARLTNICSPHWIVDEIDISDAKEITTVDRDEHRWYVIGTVVYQTGGEFFGVRGPISLKSESMGYNDVGVDCEAFEMQAVQSITYKRK